jgi:hypothetical protein
MTEREVTEKTQPVSRNPQSYTGVRKAPGPVEKTRASRKYSV